MRPLLLIPCRPGQWRHPLHFPLWALSLKCMSSKGPLGEGRKSGPQLYHAAVLIGSAESVQIPWFSTVLRQKWHSTSDKIILQALFFPVYFCCRRLLRVFVVLYAVTGYSKWKVQLWIASTPLIYLSTNSFLSVFITEKSAGYHVAKYDNCYK